MQWFFNILIKKADEIFVAHCLELDIVAARDTFHHTEDEILALISAQVGYAFSNNNLDNLYHPAPPEVWREFYACKERLESKRVKNAYLQKRQDGVFVPPWIIANTCRAEGRCHV